MTEAYLKAEHRRFILDRFGKALRKRFDEIMQEPMPDRWAELANRLNAEDDDEEPR